MDSVQIIPAVLAVTEEEYRQKLEKIEASGAFEDGWVQIDLLDNKFVQNKQSFSANKSVLMEVLNKYPTRLLVEAHLMVVDPINWIDVLSTVGAKRIIFPVESDSDIGQTVRHARDKGMEVGLSVDPETSLAKVAAFVGKIDVLLIMSVRPGFSGQDFIPESLEKIREAVNFKQENPNLAIEVDGGINEKVAKSIIEAGADNLVIGEHLIEGDIAENLEKIWEAIQ